MNQPPQPPRVAITCHAEWPGAAEWIAQPPRPAPMPPVAPLREALLDAWQLAALLALAAAAALLLLRRLLKRTKPGRPSPPPWRPPDPPARR